MWFEATSRAYCFVVGAAGEVGRKRSGVGVLRFDWRGLGVGGVFEMGGDDGVGWIGLEVVVWRWGVVGWLEVMIWRKMLFFWLIAMVEQDSSH